MKPKHKPCINCGANEYEKLSEAWQELKNAWVIPLYNLLKNVLNLFGIDLDREIVFVFMVLCMIVYSYFLIATYKTFFP